MCTCMLPICSCWLASSVYNCLHFGEVNFKPIFYMLSVRTSVMLSLNRKKSTLFTATHFCAALHSVNFLHLPYFEVNDCFWKITFHISHPHKSSQLNSVYRFSLPSRRWYVLYCLSMYRPYSSTCK